MTRDQLVRLAKLELEAESNKTKDENQPNKESSVQLLKDLFSKGSLKSSKAESDEE